MAEGQRSIEPDPLSAINPIYLGVTHMYAHRFKEAEAEFKKALEIDSAFAYAHWMYGVMLQVSGDLDGGRDQYTTARARDNDARGITMPAQLAAIMGRPEDGMQARAGLEGAARGRVGEADQ